MIKKITLLGVLLLICLLPFGPLKAQEETAGEGEPSPSEQLLPEIIAEEIIQFGKKALFDASESRLIANGGEAVFRWDFSDTDLRQYGDGIVHEFVSTGIHQVTLTIEQAGVKKSTDKEIFVYDKKILMIADKNTSEQLKLVREQAADSGVLLELITATSEETGFLTEEKMLPLISEESEFIKEADGLIFYTSASTGLQAFARYWQGLESGKKIDLEGKLMAVLTESNIGVESKLAQQSYEVMKPPYILLTRPEALNPIFETKDYSQLITLLENRGIEHRIIDARSEKSAFFFLSHAVTGFIAKGVPTNTVYLLLALPFIAFIITFARQVIGISTFGLYTPLVISLSLFILGIFFGLGTLVIIVAVSYFFKFILNKLKLLYIPKTGLILSLLGLSFLGLIWFLSYYRVSLAISLAVFPMLVMSTLSEKFLSAQSEGGLKEALLGVLKTVAVAIAAYYLVVWESFNSLIMSWPELIILPLLGIIILGRFTGLRLDEYIRFRSLFKESNIEEE